ncbi:MAG: alpha/beta hydrolase [Betaproteobacteria bacterium]|jgi:pimeloyl-ACP methyl ester carboxylesterase
MLVAGGHRLEYVLLQPPDVVGGNRPTLVFLHEGLGSVALWKRFPGEVVAATGCPALVYSRYGYGKSDTLAAPREVDYMHREALDVLPEILDQLGIELPVLIGHSDGASIALIYAGLSSRPVRGVVAMAPHVFVEDITVRSIAEAGTTFRTTDLPQRLGRYHDDVDSTFRGWNDIWLHSEFRNWNIEAVLPRVRCPLLLIQGEDDQYGTAAQVDAIARQVAGPVQTVMLPDCAHSPHQSLQKDAALAAVVDFVDTVREAG